ncbi:SEC-C domain-containing protein [Halomonas sp. ISL-60]|uniref:YchJ family protein n=1 Tax=Halomonas sp. ISL-56 TaxID=2819149 RepID=UPI001BE72F68|nr:YchJ family metal-binding protein [Halomonas sp. ISL-56]MBT2774138.1 SEC-C domain-containing protein [Halomonas sp. ISL-60]MBT2800230.1 SEC-C domain-containing protein [Halomonas sp. ISL-56]
MTPTMDQRCPCGSQLTLDKCCGRHHHGEPAPTPEALMRSRYAAFVLGLNDYLLATWHPTTRPVELAPDPETEWKSLSIVGAKPPLDNTGYVHFNACFYGRGRAQKGWHVLAEVSRFVKEQQRWWYIDGTPTLTRLKPRRNDPCLCGSGRKLKVCCGE